jgi:hypothetical protein
MSFIKEKNKIMLSFFKKSGLKPKRIIYYLKYDLPIEHIFLSLTFEHINEKYHHRLKEIIENTFSFNISGNHLKYLPNDIKNEELLLYVWYYNRNYKFPENWNILMLRTYQSKLQPKLHKSFNVKEIKIC